MIVYFHTLFDYFHSSYHHPLEEFVFPPSMWQRRNHMTIWFETDRRVLDLTGNLDNPL